MIHQSQEGATSQVTERDWHASTHKATVTIKLADEKAVAVQTVLVIPQNWKHLHESLILVNCFLDEASDRTNMTEDLIEELGVKGQKKQIVVNVANDQQVKFVSMRLIGKRTKPLKQRRLRRFVEEQSLSVGRR